MELYNRDGRNWTVETVITDRGKISWTINGDKASKTQLESLVSDLNIQTNNMCQFLPQDVVKNFPLMSPQVTLATRKIFEKFRKKYLSFQYLQ